MELSLNAQHWCRDENSSASTAASSKESGNLIAPRSLSVTGVLPAWLSSQVFAITCNCWSTKSERVVWRERASRLGPFKNFLIEVDAKCRAHGYKVTIAAGNAQSAPTPNPLLWNFGAS